MKRILIDGYEYLKGDSIEFKAESILGLEVGDKIRSIGNTKSNTASNSSDVVDPFMQYVGTIQLGEGEQRLAFLLPSQGITGWSLFNPEKKVYKLYDFDLQLNQLFCSHYEKVTIRMFKAIFSKI